MGERSFTGCFSYCYFVGDHDKGHTLHWFHPTAILGALEPVTALFFGVLIFGEQLTPRIILGILMVITAVTLIIGGKTLLKKKQDSVKAYWQIKSDFVSLPLQL